VLLVVADDMRFDSLWAMSALAGLAQRGVTFTRAYATTPLCCPSRASILTGLYARHHGVLTNEPPEGGYEVFDDGSTLATWLHSAGVRTGLVGRYLNGYYSLDIPPGWDYWFAFWQWGNHYYSFRVNDNGTRRYYPGKEEFYSTRVFGQQALRFLEQDLSRPFVLMLTPRAPHGPAIPDHLDAGTFKELELPLSPSYDEADVSDKHRGIQARSPLQPEDKEDLELKRRRQLETLLSVDRVIASLVERLRSEGRLDRTWIIFTSDNGNMLGEHRLNDDKSCAYEECVRVPLVIVPPVNPAAGGVNHHLVANIDLAPTIAAIMGVEPPSQVDGVSLLPLLNAPAPAWRDALVLENFPGDEDGTFVGLRTADRKYVRYGTGEEELYDLASDPFELQSLSSDPAWADERAALAARLEFMLSDPVTRPVARPAP
jgi:arylsulfatase A-like enzyme